MNHSSVLRVHETGDPQVSRLNVLAAAAALVDELQTWRRELPQDVAHAKARGFTRLAVDLERLRQHVDATWKVCRQYAHAAPNK